jgi:hypothetical protein
MCEGSSRVHFARFQLSYLSKATLGSLGAGWRRYSGTLGDGSTGKLEEARCWIYIRTKILEINLKASRWLEFVNGIL